MYKRKTRYFHYNLSNVDDQPPPPPTEEELKWPDCTYQQPPPPPQHTSSSNQPPPPPISIYQQPPPPPTTIRWSTSTSNNQPLPPPQQESSSNQPCFKRRKEYCSNAEPNSKKRKEVSGEHYYFYGVPNIQRRDKQQGLHLKPSPEILSRRQILEKRKRVNEVKLSTQTKRGTKELKFNLVQKVPIKVLKVHTGEPTVYKESVYSNMTLKSFLDKYVNKQQDHEHDFTPNYFQRTDGQIYRINEKPISNHLPEIGKYEDARFSRNEYSSAHEYYNAINNIIDKWANKSEYGLLFTPREKEEYYMYHFNKLYERNRDFIKNLPKTTFTLFKKLKINTFRVFAHANYNLCFLVTSSSRRNIIRNDSNHMIFDLINNYNIYRSSTFFDLQQCSPIALYLTEMMTEGNDKMVKKTICYMYFRFWNSLVFKKDFNRVEAQVENYLNKLDGILRKHKNFCFVFLEIVNTYLFTQGLNLRCLIQKGLMNVIQCVAIVRRYLCNELEQNIRFIFSFVKGKIENNTDHNLNILVKVEPLSSIPVFDQDRRYSHSLNCSSANVVLRFLDFPSERVRPENSNHIVCEFFTPFSSRNQLREHLFENLLPSYFYNRSYTIRLFEFFRGKTRYIRSCLKAIVENGKLSDIDMICQD
ncbi:hypothetical protein ABK040_003630 [Willaertia magna]